LHIDTLDSKNWCFGVFCTNRLVTRKLEWKDFVSLPYVQKILEMNDMEINTSISEELQEEIWNNKSVVNAIVLLKKK